MRVAGVGSFLDCQKLSSTSEAQSHCNDTSLPFLKDLVLEVIKTHATKLDQSEQAREEAKGLFQLPTPAEVFLGCFPSVNPFTAFHLARLPCNLRDLLTLNTAEQAQLASVLSVVPPKSMELFFHQMAWGGRCHLQGIYHVNPLV